MKAIVNSTKMRDALAKLSSVVSKVSVIPILSSVKLSFEKDWLYLTGTDLETTLVSKIECSCKEPFELLIGHEEIQNILKNLPEQPVTFEDAKKAIVISSDNAIFKLAKGGDLETFPKIPDDEFLFTLEVGEDFFSALYSADSCKNKNDMMVTTNTACLDFKNDSLSIVGTDAFLLFKKDIKAKTGEKIQSLVRDKFVNTIKAFDTGTLSIGEKFVKIEHNGDLAITRVQDNKYCAYDTIIPKDIKYNVKANRTDLIHTIKLVITAANKATKMCAFTFQEGSAKVSSHDIDYSKEGQSSIKMIHSVEIEAIGFNGGQLLHILSLLSSEDVDMCVRGPEKSIYIKPADDDTVFCLLQPVAL